MNNITFKGYYDALDKRAEFRATILKEAGYSETSDIFWKWLRGEIIPPALVQEKIAQHIGIPVEQLWPPIKQEAV